MQHPLAFDGFATRWELGYFFVYLFGFECLKLFMHCSEPFTPVFGSLGMVDRRRVILIISSKVDDVLIESDLSLEDIANHIARRGWPIRQRDRQLIIIEFD